MKLLVKSTVALEKARNTKAQIDEGIRIASKIDVLRTTLASLEAQHKAFIEKMTSEQKFVMNNLASAIDNLKEQIKELEAYKAELQQPLDAQWQFVKSKEQEVDGMIQENQNIQTKLLSEYSKQTKTTAKIKEALSRVKVNERALAQALVNADSANDEAQEVLKQALLSKQKQEREQAQRKTELDNQERANDNDFVANEHKRKLLDGRELELNARETEINDRYETLLRTINRTKHG